MRNDECPMTNIALYHNRTPDVTEANASKGYLKFKMLKNRRLICGISFYNQQHNHQKLNYKKLLWTE
ncbi:MAG: hypothetical protein JWR02_29 [Mucilaginibacter sp.]|nr:hypothetical protein [Mucilaginibacter sp.]